MRFAKPLGLASLALLLVSCGSSNTQTSSTGVTTIVLIPSTPVSIAVGNVEQYQAIPEDSSGNQVPGVVVTWSSSNFAVATISSTGLAKALSAGTTHITASANNITSAIGILTVTGSAQVQGVAAVGAPLAGAAVILKDRIGQASGGVTAADGSYSLSTTGFEPPFLLRVVLPGGGALYSVSADANADTVINVNPYTDFAVRSWYRLQHRSADASFANPMSNPAPQPAAVQALTGMLQDLLAPWMQEAGMDGAHFSPIGTPFQANGTGFDRVLDESRVDAAIGRITIGDGVHSASSVLTLDYVNGGVGVATPDGSERSYAIP